MSSEPPTPSPRKKILISGFFGFRNLGDEAILAAMLADLRRDLPGCEIAVICGDPAFVRDLHRVAAVPWTDLKAVTRELERCDLLVIGGGGLFNNFQDADLRRLLAPSNPHFSVSIAGLPLLARLLKKPFMIFAVGVGWGQPAPYLELMRFAFGSASARTVRDEASGAVLRQLGCPEAVVTADAAFRLPAADPARVEAILSREGLSLEAPTLAVVLRASQLEKGLEELLLEVGQALLTFARTRKLTILFIPFFRQPDADPRVIAFLRERFDFGGSAAVLRGDHSPSEVAAIISRCGLTLSLRFHGVVLSLLGGVPCVGVDYHQEPKISSLLNACGLSDLSITPPEASAPALIKALEEAYRTPPEQRERLRQLAKEQSVAASGNLEYLRALIGAGSPGPELSFPSQSIDLLSWLALKQTRLLMEKHESLSELSSNVEAHERAIRGLVDDGEFEKVEPLLKRLLEERPDHASWNYLLAFCLHMRRTEPALALHHYNSAFANGFDEFWVRFNRGSLQLNLGNLEAARVDLEEAQRIRPDEPGVIQALEDLRRQETRGA